MVVQALNGKIPLQFRIHQVQQVQQIRVVAEVEIQGILMPEMGLGLTLGTQVAQVSS